LKEKPNKIQLGTMNLHNFDKAISEFYEFNHTLDISIEQLYLNRNKLDVTVNKLLDFCLHIDSEQYGFNFPSGSHVKQDQVRKEIRNKNSTLELQMENEPKEKPKINVTEFKDYSNTVTNLNNRVTKMSVSNVSSSSKIKTSKDLIKNVYS
jgi:hypothetical protein